MSGPPARYWCMRFEARHNFSKEVARINRCFKNICKSMAKRTQMSLASSLMHQILFAARNFAGPCDDTVVCNLPSECSVAVQKLGLSPMDCVYNCSWFAIRH
jgi:hypothetical protein